MQLKNQTSIASKIMLQDNKLFDLRNINIK
jgi:hypothetical protein